MDKLNMLFQSIMTLYAATIIITITITIYRKKDLSRIKKLESEIEALKKKCYPEKAEAYPSFTDEGKT